MQGYGVLNKIKKEFQKYYQDPNVKVAGFKKLLQKFDFFREFIRTTRIIRNSILLHAWRGGAPVPDAIEFL